MSENETSPSSRLPRQWSMHPSGDPVGHPRPRPTPRSSWATWACPLTRRPVTRYGAEQRGWGQQPPRLPHPPALAHLPPDPGRLAAEAQCAAQHEHEGRGHLRGTQHAHGPEVGQVGTGGKQAWGEGTQMDALSGRGLCGWVESRADGRIGRWVEECIGKNVMREWVDGWR